MAIPKAAKNPVLAHHFLNFLLDEKHGYDNFANFVGYQPPLTKLDPDRLVTDEVVPANLKTAIVRESDFDTGYFLTELSPDRPDGLAERLGRVQGGCLTPRPAAKDGDRLLGRAGAARRRLALPLLRPPVLRDPRVALGTVDPIFQTPAPEWNPLDWNTAAFEFVFEGLFRAAARSRRCSCARSSTSPIATALSLLIAYPVAYFVARYGGRWKALLLARARSRRSSSAT